MRPAAALVPIDEYEALEETAEILSDQADQATLAAIEVGLAFPVARVPGPAWRLLVRLIAEMVGQLDLHRPLDQSLGQLVKQPALTKDLLFGPGAGEQLVDELVRQLLAHLVRQPLKDPRRGRRLA